MKIQNMKPDAAMAARINHAFLGGQPSQNAGVVLVTLVSMAAELLRQTGVSANEHEARAHLAALLVSPDDGPLGNLIPQFKAELRKLGWEEPS